MQERKQTYKKIFLAMSSLATIFLLTELIMQSFGKSICQTEGCKVVAQHVRFGDISILLIGLVTFSFLALLSFLDLYLNKTSAGSFINLVLIVSLACEGFFTGYQAFSIHTPCVFCLIILALMAVLGIIRLLAGEKEVLAGFASFIAVFSMLYLVLPATETVVFPEHERLILFYSKECNHCAEVMKEMQENKIPVTHLEVNGYSGFLKSMGIEHVPTLFVNDTYQKVFFTGKDAIRRYLFTCSEAAKAAEKAKQKTKAGKTNNPSKTGEAGRPLEIFNQQGILSPFGAPAPDDGMCKEDEVCK